MVYGYGGICFKYFILVVRVVLEVVRRVFVVVGRFDESDEEDGEMGNRVLKVV